MIMSLWTPFLFSNIFCFLFVWLGAHFAREHFLFNLEHFYSCFHAKKKNNTAPFRTFEQSSRSKPKVGDNTNYYFMSRFECTIMYKKMCSLRKLLNTFEQDSYQNDSDLDQMWNAMSHLTFNIFGSYLIFVCLF